MFSRESKKPSHVFTLIKAIQSQVLKARCKVSSMKKPVFEYRSINSFSTRKERISVIIRTNNISMKNVIYKSNQIMPKVFILDLFRLKRWQQELGFTEWIMYLRKD